MLFSIKAKLSYCLKINHVISKDKLNLVFLCTKAVAENVCPLHHSIKIFVVLTNRINVSFNPVWTEIDITECDLSEISLIFFYSV